MSRRAIVLGSLGAAVAVAAALVAVFAFGSSGSSQPPTQVLGAAHVAALLHGVPQHGAALGSPTAPVTLVEFADPQCPYCAQWARDTLPTLVAEYVRPGKVQLVFVGMTFVGPDSETALRTAFAAAAQGRFWNVLELLYENQGTENTGWVSETLLRSVGAAVPGLDTDRMLSERSSAAVDRALAQADRAARAAGINSTPSFELGRTGGPLQLFQPTDLEPSGITPALDAALKS
jgi:protein-disulfide isomerase